MQINKLQTFEKTTTGKNLKSKIKGVVTYFLNIIITLLPVFFLLSLEGIFKKYNFRFIEFLSDGELLWVSITTLILLVFNFIVFEKPVKFIYKCIMAIALFVLISSIFLFVILKLYQEHMFHYQIYESQVAVIVSSFLAVTFILNITLIFLKEE